MDLHVDNPVVRGPLTLIPPVVDKPSAPTRW